MSVRNWNGIQLPEPGIFTVDAQHTTVGFVARHLMVTQVRGRFEQVGGSVNIAQDPLESWASAEIATAS
ncbi:YceI family protein, partial [Phytoactinopolyspora endophytica]|uniref:YceI family protein n=1 Tax=Phytoactinopolyspora endophytica TaxID=1642495 RepID=UPI00197BE94F